VITQKLYFETRISQAAALLEWGRRGHDFLPETSYKLAKIFCWCFIL